MVEGGRVEGGERLLLLLLLLPPPWVLLLWAGRGVKEAAEAVVEVVGVKATAHRCARRGSMLPTAKGPRPPLPSTRPFSPPPPSLPTAQCSIRPASPAPGAATAHPPDPPPPLRPAQR